MKRINRTLILIVMFVCGVGLSACSYNQKHLVFYEDKVVGMDVSISPENERPHVVFGYERETDAIVPKTMICYETRNQKKTEVPCDNEPNSSQTKEIEAMSVLSNSHLEWAWFNGLVISERLATGTAANNLAENRDLLDSLSNINAAP